MEQIPSSDKFDPQEVQGLQNDIVNVDIDLATDMVAGFLAYNGYGVN